MANKFYLHNATSTLGGTLPASNASVSATVPSQIGDSGTNRSADNKIGASQTSIAITTNGTANSQPSLIGRFLTPRLCASSTWGSTTSALNFSGAASESNGGSNFQVTVSIAQWTPSSGTRGTRVFDLTTSTLEPSTTETAVSFTNAAITAPTLADGDILVIEVWRDTTAPGAATARTNTIFYDGTTEASITSNAMFINFNNSTLKFLGQGYGQAQATIRATVTTYGQTQCFVAYRSATATWSSDATDSWPDSDDAGPWAFGGGTQSHFDAASGVGTITIPGSTTANDYMYLPETRTLGSEGKIYYSLSALPSTGVVKIFLGRGAANGLDSATGTWGGRIDIGSAGDVTSVPIVDGSTLGSTAAGTMVAGETWVLRYRFVIVGNRPAVYLSTWKDGTLEPSWQKISTNTISTTAPYPWKLGAIAVNTNTTAITYTFDNLSLSEAFPQGYGQATADIKAQGRGFGQSQADIKATNNGFGQTNAQISKSAGYGQANAAIKHGGSGQAQTLINGIYTLPLIDTFTRTVVNDIGSPNTPSAETYTFISGTQANADVNGTKLTLIISDSDRQVWSLPHILGFTKQGVEIYYKASIDKFSVSDSPIFRVAVGVESLNIIPDSSGSQAIVSVSSSTISLTPSVENTSGSGVGTAYSVNDEYNIKAHFIRSSNSTTFVRLKLWKVGNTEPGWGFETTYPDQSKPGHILLFTTGNSDTNIPFTWTIDDLNIQDAWLTRAGQTQAYIKTQGYGSGQAQADIKAQGRGFGQALCLIPNWFNAQAQALINGTFTTVIDTFTRSVTDGIGSADTGGAYTIIHGPAADYDVNGTQLTVTFTSTGEYNFQLGKVLLPKNNEVLISFKFNQLPSSGSYVLALHEFLGSTDTPIDSAVGTYGELDLHNTGSFTAGAFIKASGGTANVNGYVAGDFWYLKFRTLQTSTGLKATVKTWKIGTIEPDWQVSSPSSTPALPGHLGIYAQAESGVILTLDDYNAYEAFPYGSGQAQVDIKAQGRGFGQALCLIPNWFNAQAQALISGTFTTVVDTFTRSIGSGLGTADTGGAYNPTTSTRVSTNGTQGLFTTDGNSDNAFSLDSVLTPQNIEILITFSFSAQPIGGYNNIRVPSHVGSRDSIFIGSVTGAGIGPDGKIVAWAKGSGSTSVAYTLGDLWYLKVRVLSTTTETTFSSKAWKIGTSEPAWMVTNTIAHVIRGHVGLYHEVLDTAHTLILDDYNIYEAFPYGSGQAQAKISTVAAVSACGQAQADIKQTYTASGQSQADVKAVNSGLGQAQSDIKATSFGSGQAQADIKATNFGLGQANSDIKNIATNYSTPYGQANVDIKNIATNYSTPYGQANSDIKNIATNYSTPYGQAQADIKAVGQGFGQTQADIKASGFGLGQCQADIKAIGYGFGQTQCDIKQTYTQFGQCQADIKQTYFGLGQAQADIKATSFGSGQTQADIKTTYWGSGQSQADIKQTSNGFGQAQCTVTGNAFGQTQTDVRQTYWGSGQSQADIRATYWGSGQCQAAILGAVQQYGQAQVDILTEGFGSGNTQTDIKTTYWGSGQTQADILHTYYGSGQAQCTVVGNAFGQTQADIKQTYTQFGQAQCTVTGNAFGQSQTNIKAIGYGSGQTQCDILAAEYGFGQAQSDVKQTYYQFGQAQTDIVQTYWGSGQANCDIKQVGYGSGQTQADILQVGYGEGQANADIKQVGYGEGQAQTDVKVTYNQFGQTQADIVQTYNQSAQAQVDIQAVGYGSGQAQSDIKATNYGSGQAQAKLNAFGQCQFGQAQCNIRFTGTVGCGQAQCKINAFDQCVFGQTQADIKATQNGSGQSNSDIKATNNGFGQAQSDIKITYSQCAQANADIKQTNNGFGQCQADIKQTYFGLGQCQADIKAVGYGSGQAQCDVKAVGYGSGQAQCTIQNTPAGYGQCQADIKSVGYGLGQAQCDVKAQGYGSGQAQCSIAERHYQNAQCQATIKIIVPESAQAQTDILATINNFGQTQADILAISTKFGQAQADIKVRVIGVGQAQGDIRATFNGSGQANSNIINGNDKFAQAQASIVVRDITASAQAEAVISKSAGYAQAQGYIFQPHTLKRLLIGDRDTISLTVSHRRSDITISIDDRDAPLPDFDLGDRQF